MQDSKNGNLYALIGAICFAVYTAYSVISDFYYEANSRYYSITWKDVVWWLVFIGFAVLLFSKKKSTVFLVAPALGIIMDVISFIQYSSFISFLFIVIYVVLFCLLMINVIPAMNKNAGVTKVLWFIPAGLYFVTIVFNWISIGYFRFIYIFFALVLIAGYLFLGLWLKETVPVLGVDVQHNQYATVNPQPTMSQVQQVIGGADKLKMYKDLLDSGAITQEEFDAKKKQILG